MSKFTLSKKLDLSKYKEGAYLEFNLPTYKEIDVLSKLEVDSETKDPVKIKKGFDDTITVLASKFKAGRLPNADGGLEDVLKDDLKGLPIEVLNEAVNFLLSSPVKG